MLGLLAHTMADTVQATSHFEDALSFCRKAGYRPEVAWTCSDYAECLLDPSTSPILSRLATSGRSSRRADTENRAKATALLDEALSISSDLGMRPLMERIAAIQERVDAQRVSTPAYPDGLTQREVEVIRLVAAGKTDREIAGELIISINTVGNHVRSILNKTNSTNRTEAATYAARNGLV